MTKELSTGQARTRAWRRRALVLAAVAALAVPAGVYFSGRPSQQDALEQAIVKLQFFPVQPPSNLRGPGSLYHVDVNGNIQETVCQADQVLVSSLAQESPTALVVARDLENAGYAIDGNVLDRINAKLKAKQLQSVRYELRDVKVIEISQADLAGISKRLLMNPNCAEKIGQLVRARELICQGASVLLASADYLVELEQSAEAKSMAKGDLQVFGDELGEPRIGDDTTVKAQLGAQSESSTAGSSYRLSSGKNLYYGIKVSPLCVTPPEASLEWRVPRNRVERMMYRLWQLSPF